jgi:hypothetical protein
MPDEIDMIIEKLILIGAMEVAGVNEEGEFLYGITPKLREIQPELFKMIQNTINDGIMSLWVEGFLDVDMMQDEPTVKLTEKCFDEEALAEMHPDSRKFLEGIIERFQQ